MYENVVKAISDLLVGIGSYKLLPAMFNEHNAMSRRAPLGNAVFQVRYRVIDAFLGGTDRLYSSPIIECALD